MTLVISRRAALKPKSPSHDEVHGSGGTLRKGLSLQPERIRDISNDLFYKTELGLLV